MNHGRFGTMTKAMPRPPARQGGEAHGRPQPQLLLMLLAALCVVANLAPPQAQAASLPTLTVNNITVSEGNSGTRNATFTVRLSAAKASSVSVNYATANGTATAPSDYLARVGVVTLPAWTTSKTFSIPVVGDTRLEPDETFFVNFSNPVGALLGTTRAQATILNDEAVPSTLYVDDNAPNDPGPGNPLVSDPLENGSTAHPFDNIQEAMNIQRTGGWVMVIQGTYRENLKFNGKNIVVLSTDPLTQAVVAATVVDGGGAGPVVTFNGTESANCILAGLTLTKGAAPNGGGILGNGTKAALYYNRITTNTASVYGGGIYRCQGTIQYNTISGNQVRNSGIDQPVAGGGLYDCDGLIRENTITNNTVLGDGHYSALKAPLFGAGLAGCDGTIEYNEISGNLNGSANSYTRGSGGGLYGCQGAIRGNRIANNRTIGYGGGLSGCNGIIVNNNISNNFGGWGGGGLNECNALIIFNRIEANTTAEGGGGLAECNAHIFANVILNNNANRMYGGGGLYHCPGVIESNIIAGNTAYETGSGLSDCDGTIVNNTIVNNQGTNIGVPGVSGCDGVLANNILWGNYCVNWPTGTTYLQIRASALPSYSTIQGWTGGGVGNSAEDPRFIDPASDLRLQAGSPAIDSGSNALVPKDFDDLDNDGNITEPEPYDYLGNPRLRDGDRNGSVTVDRGALEFQ